MAEQDSSEGGRLTILPASSLRDVRSDVYILERRLERIQEQTWRVRAEIGGLTILMILGWIVFAASNAFLLYLLWQ